MDFFCIQSAWRGLTAPFYAEKYAVAPLDFLDGSHDLSITSQAHLLGLSRASVYYQLPNLVPAAEIALMRRIDELHIELPFAGIRNNHETPLTLLCLGRLGERSAL